MTTSDDPSDRMTALLTSLGFYCASLFLHGINCGSDYVTGAKILAYGWFGALKLDFAWFANPLYFIAVITLYVRANKASTTFVWAALLVGCLSFFTKFWYFNESYPSTITSLGLGFYVWMMSFLVLLGGTVPPEAGQLPEA